MSHAVRSIPAVRVRDAEANPSAPEANEEIFFSRGAVAGVPWIVLGHLVGTVCLFGVSVVTVRALGPEKFGVFTLCRGVFEYLAIFCGLGLNVSLLRFIPELVVRQNKAGLTRLLWKSAVLQTGAGILCAGALVLSRPWLESRLQVDLSFVLVLTGILICARLVRLFVEDCLTAFLQLRAASLLGMAQSVLRLALAVVVLTALPEVYAAIGVHIAALLIAYPLGAGILVSFVRRLRWSSAGPGIGVRRVARISGPKLFNHLIVGISNRYAEIFFLGAFVSPAAAGMFELAYAVPLMAVSAIPWSLRRLYVSAFAEAYAKDPGCTPRLVGAFCRLTAVVVLPVSIFGAFFGSLAVELIYGKEFSAAGTIASVLFVHHAVVLLTSPYTAPILAMGKELQMTGIIVVQILVNLLLDYVLISSYGLYGAVAAVLTTFVVNTPIRFFAARRLVGGLFLPVGFYLKISAPLIALGVALAPLKPDLSLLGLVGLGFVYLTGALFLIRALRLLGVEDVRGFQALGIPMLDRALSILGATDRRTI